MKMLDCSWQHQKYTRLETYGATLVSLHKNEITDYYTYFQYGKKRYTNFGQNGCEIWEIIEIGIDVYIYSWSGRKKKLFGKNLSVRAQKLGTLKLKNG